MEMQFDKMSIAYLQKLTGGQRVQEETLELRLPEGMPDIGRVLGAWGQAVVRGKEWNGDHMTVSCGVMAWVLYVPEEEEGVRSVEAWLPVSMKWDLPDTPNDGTITAACLLKSIDARSTSARKLMVRAALQVSAEAWLPAKAQVSVAGELPKDIQLLTATYPVMLPCEAGEKAFLLEEQLPAPTTGVKIEKLLYYCLTPELADKKVMAGKVVFRGKAQLHILYLGEDGKLYSCDHDLPFSQYGDLEGEYGADAAVSVGFCVTSLDLSLDAEGVLQLKAGIVGQYLLCDREMVTVAEDAYSPCRPLCLQMEPLQLPAILDQTQQTVYAEAAIQTDAQQIIDVSFYPAYGQLKMAEDSASLPLSGQFQTLYYDRDGELCSAAAPWSGQWNIPMAADAVADMQVLPAGKPQAVCGAGTLTLRADTEVEGTVFSGQGISMLTGIEAEETAKPDPDRPSLILCRKGSRRLWDVAKETGSTVEAIVQVNNLDAEPESSKLLLIPIK